MKTKIVLLTVLFACGIAAAEEPVPYANDFATRTSGATPSDRWMETSYIPGALVRSVSGIASEGREPYNSATAYQDGWAMKTGYCRSSVLFTVADDGGNQAALVNANSSSYQSTTVAMQPFYNEFTNGVLKVSVDIRTPAQTDSLNPASNAFALCGPVYRSTLDVTASSFSAPMYFGPASLYDNREGKTNGWFLRTVSRGRNTAESSASYYGQYDSRNDIAAGSWVRYEAVLDLDAGTYTATFANLGTAHPTPATAGGSAVDFRRWEGTGNVPTTFSFVNPLTERTGGIAGLAFYVQGIKQATDAADAPMFDNIAVSWKAPGTTDFVSAYENDFSTRRYRQVEPAGTTSGAYVPVLTTNIVQSSFYERANINNDYGVKEDNARRLVPDGAPYAGQDGWRRIAGGAYFTMVDPNKDGGSGWNNASVLRATGSGKTGMIAAPLGTTVSSGKVRLYCDILMGAITNSASNTRDISAAAFLAGDGAFTNAYYNSERLRVADVTTALRNKGVCGAGTCYSDRAKDVYHTNTRLYRFNGSSYSTIKDNLSSNVWINSGRWGRYVTTLDLDAGKYDVAIYNLGYVGQPMDYDHSSSTLLIATNNLSLAASAIRNVDSVVLFSEGQDNANSKYTTYNSKKLGRFPLFDNVRVCLVNDDGTDGTELYACNFEYGYRMLVRNTASLVGNTDREGADRWIRRGNAYGTISAIDAGGGDNVVVLDSLGWIGNVTRAGYAVQPIGSITKNCASVDFAADIRPPACFARDSSCFAYVEVGGDAYAQGVYRPASNNNWRREPRIGFGFSVGAGYNAVKQYTNVVLTVQSVASTGSSATSVTSAANIDTSHWYRFRVKAKPNGGKFTVKVYDQGATKPLAADVDGSLVATFEDLTLPAFGGEGMTTIGLAGAGFHGFFGGGLDDPNVALVDNLSVKALRGGTLLIVR